MERHGITEIAARKIFSLQLDRIAGDYRKAAQSAIGKTIIVVERPEFITRISFDAVDTRDKKADRGELIGEFNCSDESRFKCCSKGTDAKILARRRTRRKVMRDAVGIKDIARGRHIHFAF